MIHVQAINHRDASVAQKIHAVLMLAYAQEARLLQAQQFVPLSRTVADVQASDTYYLGVLQGEELVGALSLGRDDEAGQISIESLVVHPKCQRQGIGRSLVIEALRRGTGMVFSVSTGAKNEPALKLYRKLGFVEYRHGTIGHEKLPLVKLRTGAP